MPTIHNEVSQISVANTNRDGTGTIVDSYTAVAGGSQPNRIDIKAVGTTTAGMIRLYIFDGTNTRLLKEFTVSPITPSGTVASWETSWTVSGIRLSSGQKLRASTHNAETFNVTVYGIDL